MSDLSNDILVAFESLAPLCGITAPICKAVSSGSLSVPTNISRICTNLGLAQAQAGAVSLGLDACSKLDIVKQESSLTWIAGNKDIASLLYPLLEGASLYKERVHADANTVEVVLTRPPSPSKMSVALENNIEGSWLIRDTKNQLPSIAEAAESSFIVMTPFIDETGTEIIVNLFARTTATEKWLVIRATQETIQSLQLNGVIERLREIGVKIANFRLDHPKLSYETFHAKVVLSDDKIAYVGSSNMNKWSFEYSLELGLQVNGEAAKKIGNIVRAIIEVSEQI